MKIFLCFTIFAIKRCSCPCVLFSSDVSQTTFTIYNINYPNGTPLDVGTIITGTDIFVLAHEWLFNSQVEWIVETIPNLLRLYPNANVVVIDYSSYSNNPLFIPNVCTSSYVGQATADKLIALNADPSLISCTGHSMGAQVCGALARRFIEKNQGKISRLTGIDAAGPAYDNHNHLFLVIPITLQQYISKDDAQRVVGIYTDSNGYGFGMNRNPGYSHISIIINGGNNQPSCPIGPICPISLVFGIMDLTSCIFCSHRFSRDIYWRGIAGRKYTVTKCNNYNDYQNGSCNANPEFDYSEKLEATVADGIYHIKINSNFEQIAYNA